MATIHLLDFQRDRRRRKKALAATFAKPIPKDSSYPLVGRLFDLQQDPIGLCRKLYDRLGPVFSTRLMHKDIVTCSNDSWQYL